MRSATGRDPPETELDPHPPLPQLPQSFASIAFEVGVIDNPPSAVQRSSRAMFSLICRCASSTSSSGIKWS
jgi:hypothetical protein